MRLLLLFLAIAIVVACNDSGGTLNSAREIDIDALTIEDVRKGAVEAITRPGLVFHLRSSEQPEDEGVWIDVGRDVARREAGDDLTVFYERRIATVQFERFSDAPFTSPVEPPSLFALTYMGWLFEEKYNERSIRAGEVGDLPAIVVEVRRDLYDYDAEETARIYFDEEFIPRRMERDDTRRGVSETAIDFEASFVPAGSLPADFFSPEAVRARARVPQDDLNDAVAAGMTLYWLGPTFEETVLRPESGLRDADEGAGRMLVLEYAPEDPSIVSPCLRIENYDTRAWESMAQRYEQRTPSATTTIHGRTLHRYPQGPAPPPGPIVGGGSQPPSPVVPDDTGGGQEAVILLEDGGATVVLANCGPAGSNAFRTAAGFERVLAALDPFVPH